MRKLALVVVSIFAFVGCNNQKKVVENDAKTAQVVKEYKVPKIEYEANSRGFYERITIENQMVSVTYERDAKKEGEPVAISDDINKELSSYLNSVKLDQLATYKDPTQKRFYDGAAIANLKITVDGVEYRTVDFDHGFPPVEIEKLVNRVVSFSVKK
jgi:hypothetical protein